jgi:ubiquinone/menaquinone biosynthesis C-methylase UbiE
MNFRDHIWKSEALGKQFLAGVRGAIPFGQEQIELMLLILQEAPLQVRSFLDLGCGDGVLGRALFGRFPEARGLFLDFSETMIAAARQRLSSTPYDAAFVVQDYGQPAWLETVVEHAPFDVIVSRFSIHHQPDERKRAIYHQLFDLLLPGGWFLNLEHVASASPWLQGIFDACFIESLCRYHQRLGSNQTAQQIAEEYLHRPDKAANILAPVAEQCQWLRDIGFENVDCYFKVFELALFGGAKPQSAGTATPRKAPR